MHAHVPTGQWRRRYKGKDYYFGPIADPKAALGDWRARWHDIESGKPEGQVVRTEKPVGFERACLEFLATKLHEHRDNRLGYTTYCDYRAAVRRLCSVIGKATPLGSITPHEFDRVMETTSGLSPIVRSNLVVRIRTIFKWINDERYGLHVHIPSSFRGAPMSQRREQREKLENKLYEPAHIHRLLKVADPIMRAAILMGINGGYGAKDLAQTKAEEFKPDIGEIVGRRHKSKVKRRVILWPETVEAVKAATRPGSEHLLTWNDGSVLQTDKTKKLTRVFKVLRMAAGVENTFYGFRYTFSTVADELNDERARDITMGHAIIGVPDNYVQRFSVDRLRAVSDHVHKWLFKSATSDRRS